MRCNECYWADNCLEYGEECMDFYSIYEEPQLSDWSYEDWYTYVAEYDDGNIDYEEGSNEFI